MSTQQFIYDRFVEDTDPVFERVSPDPETYTRGFEEDDDFFTMTYSGSGDVTAELVAVGGIVSPSPGGSTSGCAAGDFAGFPAGASRSSSAAPAPSARRRRTRRTRARSAS